MKIGVVCDLHLSDKNLSEKAANWDKAITKMTSLGVERIIICGDTFDFRNIVRTKEGNLGDVIGAFVDPLVNSMIKRVDVIDGNHCIGNGDGLSSTRAIEYMSDDLKIYVHHTPDVIEWKGFKFAMLPWMSKDLESAQKFLETIRGKNAFLFAHLMVEGSELHPGYYKVGGDFNFSRAELESLGCKRIYCGHIHKKQQVSQTIIYPGALMANSYADANNPQGFIVLDIDEKTGKIEESYISMDNEFPCWLKYDAKQYAQAQKAGLIKKQDHVQIKDLSLPEGMELPANVTFRQQVNPIDSVTLRADVSLSDSPMILFEKYCDVNGFEVNMDEAKKVISNILSELPDQSTTLGSLQRINSISLSGIGSFRDPITWELPDGIIGISGNNGMGKTYLLSSPTAALYGVFPSKTNLSDQINCRKTEAELTLDFRSNDTDFIATRVIPKDGAQKASLRRKDEKKFLCKLVREMNNEIGKMVGDKGLFLSAAMTSQNRSNSFLMADRAERKRIYASLLGFDRLESIHARLKEIYQKRFSDYASLQDRYNEITYKDPDAIAKELAELEKSLKEQKGRLEEAEKTLREARDTVSALNQEYKQHEQALALQQSIQKQVDKILQDVQKEFETDELRDSRIAEYEDQIVTLKDKLEALTEEMRQITKSVEEEAEGYRKELVELNSQYEASGVNPEIESGYRSRLDEIHKGGGQAVLRVNNANIEMANKRKNLQDELARLQKSAGLLKDVGCAPNFLDCSLIKKAKADHDRIESVEEAIGEIEIQILEDKHNEADKLLIETLNEEEADIILKLNEIQASLASAKKLQKQADELRDKLSMVSSASHLQSCTRKQNDEKKRVETAISTAEQAKTNLVIEKGKSEAKVKAWEQQLETEKSRLANIVIRNISDIQTKINEAKSKESLAQNIVDSIDLGEFQVTRGRLFAEKDQAIEAKKKKDALAIQLQEYSDEPMYKLLLRAFSRAGISQLLTDSTLPILKKTIHELLADFDSDFQVNISTTSVSNEGKMMEVLDILISDSEGSRDIANYSGGERSVLEIVFRIAFAKLQATREGSKIQVLFIDEASDQLDNENTEKVLMVFQKLIDQGFNQIFIVSHNEGVIANLPTNFNVYKDQGTSKIRRMW